MSNAVHTTNILASVLFSKKGSEIKTGGDKRLKQLNSKVKEREVRITNLRKEYEISDSDLVELMRKAMNDRDHIGTYSIRSVMATAKAGGLGATRTKTGVGTDVSHQEYEKVVPAGVIQNILTEQSAIENEKDQIERLEIILRNLDIKAIHKVSLFDLEYLGF